MAIRNRLFQAFNTVHRIFNVEAKFLPYTCTTRNEALVNNHTKHQTYLHFSKKDQNLQNITRSTLDEFQKMEFNVITQFQRKGLNDQHVDPHQIIYQLDRIEVLRKLKVLEQNAGSFPKDEAQCLKLIAKVHLEEPNAQENLDKFIEANPQCRRLLYLGQI
ncbi:unnamed protein product [Paramecium primaurelia]|uniref:Uncharacterized protein n=2 Tax=Paramecium TaxID=5884 RepID=A0A8S1X945_9CILI|nr:unnamed protein product [Paramecium primaurelia]CAD8197518.1 unnamed protein product [Paramecium pentaurelia]